MPTGCHQFERAGEMEVVLKAVDTGVAASEEGFPEGLETSRSSARNQCGLDHDPLSLVLPDAWTLPTVRAGQSQSQGFHPVEAGCKVEPPLEPRDGLNDSVRFAVERQVSPSWFVR